MKRVLDLVLTIATAPVWLPLMALVACAVRVALGSPVFFVQERAGRGGRPFRLFKFRSMRTGPGTDAERLTPFGRFLRASSLDELYSLAKTKRYSHARIRRAVAALLLGIEASDCEGIPPYIRVLGFNSIGREKLRAMRSSAKLPIVMRAADIKKLGERAKRISSIEERAADLFSLALPSIMPCGAEYTDEIAVI